jgi:hypothetical protein
MMAVEGHAAIVRSGGDRKLAIATMDDELLHRPQPFADQFSLSAPPARCRRQPDQRADPPVRGRARQGHLMPSRFTWRRGWTRVLD